MNAGVQRMAVVSASLVAILATVTSGAQAESTPASGVLWETQSRMSMDGMTLPVPAQKFTKCTPAEWTEPPASGGQGQSCVTSNFRRDGNKVNWTSVCTRPSPMTGQGEITFDGPDDYSGTIQYASEDGNLVISLTGHRSGSCDHPQ